jgi:hypothetical protein
VHDWGDVCRCFLDQVAKVKLDDMVRRGNGQEADAAHLRVVAEAHLGDAEPQVMYSGFALLVLL